MPVLERIIEEKACAYAEHKLGMRALKLRLATNSGWPDRTFLYKGRAIFIEFKRPGEKAEPLQQHTLERLERQGFKAVVCDDLDKAIFILDNWKKYVDDQLSV